jgi:type I restriction enzyme S subunit
LKNHFFKEDLIGGGAIYAATNKKELENLEVLYPTAKLVDEFDSKAQVIDAQIKALILQNAELTCARDLLLPRLMDGRIPV